MEKDKCFFCGAKNKKIIFENDLFYSRWDDFPVSKGHAEIVAKKHIISFFKLNNKEIVAAYNLLNKTVALIKKKYKPDGFNIGVNEGLAAGRSVDHLHIHIIPRYKSGVRSSEGGIRNIIPGKGKY